MIGKFHFQQHYVIMLITLSFGYAAAMHPTESYMVFYGFAYVFIFPAMHILLPIYSISNIIDQSWGTRDAVSCFSLDFLINFIYNHKKWVYITKNDVNSSSVKMFNMRIFKYILKIISLLASFSRQF